MNSPFVLKGLEVHSIRSQFFGFAAEQFPWLLQQGIKEWDKLGLDDVDDSEILTAGNALVERLLLKIGRNRAQNQLETTPFVHIKDRIEQENERIRSAMQGVFERFAIARSISIDEWKWVLQGMILTRAVDNEFKRLFMSGEFKYGNKGFQGKGFRSLGQEAISAAAVRLRRGKSYSKDGVWTGDIVAPLIRDLGIYLAFSDDVEAALNAQVGKDAPPMTGKDLHYGDLSLGVLPAAAPLSVATCAVTGMGMAIGLQKQPRIGISFIGEGGCSLGEWHEAINFACVHKLPLIFCVQNNQTALSTPVSQQSAVRVFGDKAIGYGIGHVSIDGTDPINIASTFSWAAEKARRGRGPILIEVICMRMCGHAHHDDMLYLGREPEVSFEYPTPKTGGYVDVEKYKQWMKRDPIQTFAKKMIEAGYCSVQEVEGFKKAASKRCREAVENLKKTPWPKGELAKSGVFAADRESSVSSKCQEFRVELEQAPPFSSLGNTFLEGIAKGLEQALVDKRVYVLGEDVGPPYGNAFMLLKSLVARFGNRLINTPISEAAIIGACVGMAIEGLRPIGEIQFNDFVACGFNQLVNSAAKFHYRTGRSVPMVLRMPFGGLRCAGPYHSQDTIPWFHRSFGLKIVVPSTPFDAMQLLLSAVSDVNPVLFYEHIALYRNPEIKQRLSSNMKPIPLGKAAFRSLGSNLTLISYGAFVHRILDCAKQLEQDDGATCDVIDLRSIVPLDFEAISASVKKTGKVLLVGEDSRTGSVLESIASKISQELFEHLDGPVQVIGSLDTPVPYSPSLEENFLPSKEQILLAARQLCAY